ncbi:MAG: ParA family protein [Legionella sp.]|nr:ParA family protein [Legionella sp.]
MVEMLEDLDINDRIKKIIDENSLEQADVAEITGYSPTQIKKWLFKKDQKSYTRAPVQALKLLEIWQQRPNISSNASQQNQATPKLAEIWSIITNKGGVGKTTQSFNFAVILANTYGKKVLAIDLDPQGHLSLSLVKSPVNIGLSTSDLLLGRQGHPFQYNERLDVIATGKELRGVLDAIPPQDLLFRLKERIQTYRETYDVVICDGIPTDSPWFDAILAASTKIVLPFTIDLYDSWGIQDVFDKVEVLKMRKVTEDLKVAAIVGNAMSKPMSVFDNAIIHSLKEAYPKEFCPVVISKSVKIKECKSPAISKSIVDYEPRSRVADEYLSVVDFILNA